MTTRRAFLLGLSGLVTASFVAQAKRHIIKTSAPLLIDPGRAEETLYLYDMSQGDTGFKWRVSLGPDIWPPPPPPTWREYLKAKGCPCETEIDLENLWRDRWLTPEELDQRLDGYGWESEWEQFHSPQAKAAILLQELKLDCSLTERGAKAGRLNFVNCGGHPGSCERWVDLRDDLTVSLLQARLVEGGHPIKVEVGEA